MVYKLLSTTPVPVAEGDDSCSIISIYYLTSEEYGLLCEIDSTMKGLLEATPDIVELGSVENVVKEALGLHWPDNVMPGAPYHAYDIRLLGDRCIAVTDTMSYNV